MSWTLLKLKFKSKNNQNRNEEVSDIIDKMPTSFGKWVAIAVIVFTLLFFVFGWVIKYPDVVTGQIKISSNVAPIKLPANISGKLDILDFVAQDYVNEGDYIAVIQSSANPSDIQKIASLLSEFDPNQLDSLRLKVSLFPEKVSLGELNIKYYSFFLSLKSIEDYYDDNIYEQQRISLEDEIKWKRKLLAETQNALKISDENLNITEKWYERYLSMNKDIVATYDLEVDKSKIELLQAKQQNQNMLKEITSLEMQISENENQLSKLLVEQNEKERKMHLDLLATYHDLKDQIKKWEQTYVLKAPFDGQVEFLKFWTDGQFVQASQAIFGVVPKENSVLGQVLLPALGAGKVKEGSVVSIKLDDYPYAEFGSIKGVVKSISLITNENEIQQSSVNTYLVIVNMPDGLITNYGNKLDFKYEIGGQADIIVKDRRLIERLFDNIRFSTK